MYAKTKGKVFSPLNRRRKMPFSASKNKILKSICYLLSAGIAEYITQHWYLYMLSIFKLMQFSTPGHKKLHSHSHQSRHILGYEFIFLVL